MATLPPVTELSSDAAREDAALLAGRIEAAVAGAVRAPERVLRAAVAGLVGGGHLMIEDVPGVGKTALAKSLAAAAGCDFARLQCTSDLLPADVTGVTVWDAAAAVFRFRPGPVFAHVVLADEVNRASPKTQSALLECMEEGQVSVDGDTRRLPEPFMVIATQNPVEYEGTYPLPEAQLDRFALRLSLGYPPARVEAEMLLDPDMRDVARGVPRVADPEAVMAARAAADGVFVAPEVARYVVSLLVATRRDPRLELGASPRAGLSLLRTARALALRDGRDHVQPGDVKLLAPMALPHRVVVAADTRAAGVTADAVIEDLVARAPVPL